MVRSRPEMAEELRCFSRIPRGAEDDLLEQFQADRVRAGKGGQYPPLAQTSRRLEVDLLVAPRRSVHLLPRLGERRGVKDDQIEHLLRFPQIREAIVREDRVLLGRTTVPGEVSAGDLVGRRGGIDGDDASRPPTGGINGKGAGVGEGVQNCGPPAEGADDLTVPALIEEKPRLLACNQIDLEAEAVFGDLRRDRNVARRRADPVRHPLELTGTPLAPFVDPRRSDRIGEMADESLPPFLHPRRPDAEHKKAAVTVDNEAGHPVPFCIDEAIGVRFRRNDLLPQGYGPIDPPTPEIGVDPGGRITGQKAEGDVAGVEKTEAEAPADAVRRKNDVAGRRISFHLGYGPGEDPGVAVAKRGLSPLLEYDPRIAHHGVPFYHPPGL